MGIYKKIDLWFKYNDTYIEIQKNPRARRAMFHDPGVKFMRRGWWIVWFIICILSVLGKLYG